MKIRKFYENEQMSSDRLDELISDFIDMAEDLDKKGVYIERVLSELSQFKNRSEKIDQVDETITSLQLIKKNFVDSISQLDSINKVLENYKIDGSKYMI